MALRMTLAVAVLALIGVTVAPARSADVTGRIIRIEPEQHVVVLSDGRTYRLPSNTVVHVEGRPVALSALAPGQTVAIRAGQAVEVQNGHTIVVSRGQTGTPADAAPAVVVTPPATTPVGVRQTLYGTIEDVDDDGTVKVDTGRDSFKVKLSRDLVRSVREGDTVRLEMTVVPAGAPATAPR